MLCSNLVTKILMRTILNIRACHRFPTPGIYQRTYVSVIASCNHLVHSG